MSRLKRVPDTLEGDIVVTPVAGHYAIGRVTADGRTQSVVESQETCVLALRRACALAVDGRRVFLAHGTHGGSLLIDPTKLEEYAQSLKN